MSSHKAAREKIAKLNGFFAPKREERRIPPHIPPPHLTTYLPMYISRSELSQGRAVKSPSPGKYAHTTITSKSPSEAVFISGVNCCDIGK
jgi:hypothetical protein